MTAVLALAVAALFCLVRSVFDLAARRYGWGLAGVIVAIAILLLVPLPLQTHAVKIDLPAAGPGR